MPQAIESLIVRRIELHLPRKTMQLSLRGLYTAFKTQFTLGHSEVPELFSVATLFQQECLSQAIIETHLTCSLADHGTHLFGNNLDAFWSFRDGIAILSRYLLGYYHKTLHLLR